MPAFSLLIRSLGHVSFTRSIKDANGWNKIKKVSNLGRKNGYGKTKAEPEGKICSTEVYGSTVRYMSKINVNLQWKNEKNSLDERNLTKQTVTFCRTGNGSQYSITRSNWKRTNGELMVQRHCFGPTVSSTRIRIQAFSLMQNCIRIRTWV